MRYPSRAGAATAALVAASASTSHDRPRALHRRLVVITWMIAAATAGCDSPSSPEAVPMPDPPDIPTLTRTFDDILERYDAWSVPRNEYVARNLPRVNQDGYTWEQFERGRQELEARLLEEHDPFAEVHAVMEELAPAYLAATATDRARIRGLVAERRPLSMMIRGYADALAAELDSPQGVDRLAPALAAISIEDCRTDYRDTLMSLADLFVGAEEVGMDPAPHLHAVAELSSTETPRGGETPVAEMLRKLETYAIVAERRRRGTPYHQR